MANTTLGAGITMGAGITLKASIVPTELGIPLTYIAGLPQDLYPGVSVAGKFSPSTYNSQFIIQTTATYGVPTGFVFLDSWYWSRYDPTLVAISTTNTVNDTATAISADTLNAVFGNIAIAPGARVMYSVNHSVYENEPDGDAVGVGSATAPISGSDYNFLGINDQSLAVYDDGVVWTNGSPLNNIGPYEKFETDGQIIDVAVDTVTNKMWYRVAGGVWQG